MREGVAQNVGADMAGNPTAEESARKILAILLEGGALVGKGSLIATIDMLFQTSGGSAEEFLAGMTFAMERTWIAREKNNFVLFTEAGYDEALADSTRFIGSALR